MQKTRTTITLPAQLIKQAKHKAIEEKLNLSSLIERSLKEFLETTDPSFDSEENSKEDRKRQLKKIAGSIQAGVDMNPKRFKQFIEHTYEEEVLS